MKKNEYEKIMNEDIKNEDDVISIEDLANKEERTLLYGYNCNRNSWHVYIKGKEIVTVRYSYEEEPKSITILENGEYIPNKRIYPECSDYEFCKVLLAKGYDLPFTVWNDREEKRYYGKVI